jgi:hypothetical protein
MYFLVCGPKYLRMASFLTKAAMAPAMKKAGMRQVRVCSDMYSIRPSIPPCSAPKSVSIVPSPSISIIIETVT